MMDTISRLRSSRAATLVAAVLFVAVGGYVAFGATSQLQLAAGIVFVIVGLLGLYNGLAGESVVKTLRRVV